VTDVVVCSDLDRTLIYSAAALGLRGRDEDMPRLLCVEFYRGAPLSYVTETAARTLQALADTAVFVPVTTRTPEQYARVRLLDKPPAYAICANGAVVYDPITDTVLRAPPPSAPASPTDGPRSTRSAPTSPRLPASSC